MRFRMVSGALLLALAAGCASYETLEIDRRQKAGHFVKSKEKDGLVVAAESYFEGRKSEVHFWFDLGAEGYIPIVLYFDNLSDRGFVLAPADVSLFLKKEGAELPLAPVMDVVRDVRYGYAPSILAFPFLLFVGPIWNMAHRAGMNFDLEVDYRRKDLFRGRSAVRIPPRSPLEGAVFCALQGRSDPDLAGAVVRVVLTREKGAGEAEAGRVEFLVDLE